MISVPIEALGLRRKFDVQWMKGIWFGRLDESDGHVVLTPHQSLDEQCEDKLETSEFSQIWWESSRVCFRENFRRCYLHLCPSGQQVKPIPINWPKNKTELHRESKWKDS